ncbi:MAG TPA: glycosyltransferase [Saprospiraceae bacterium]|jgi:glycosyltransferase involved in cell wall biosynthesis|nr:glycosyltransferase [Saprospiraceae bacterium]HMX85847.1 glycosyltransferase [Saprospiraceae bacterium]HMZ73700.1 glycosyltransferase [Saprospiraceae bacterium]HNA42864.1 glycosyltransferase [Saprospiraceae bacterium]HND16416.1 glycosyltransferase [Saprospiraceae bacterium]
MKKIIFCVTNDLVTDQRMMRICSTLAEDGYEVELVGRLRKNSTTVVAKSSKQTRLKCWFDAGKLFYVEYNIRLFFYLIFRRFDILGAVDLDTILPVYLVSKLRFKPATFDAHEYFEEVPEVSDRAFVKKIWTIVGNWCVPGMKLCYTVGPALADIFTKKYKRPFHVIRNMPIQKDIASVQLPLIAQPYLLYQGALNEGRGLEPMIEAMNNLPEYRLIIAGAGYLKEELILAVKKYGLQKRVIFTGNLDPDQLDGFTAGAYVGLNLLENKGKSYYYSLANKFFDYVQFGIPVLTMDFPEYAALNKEYEVAVLIDNLRPETIIRQLQLLHSDLSLHTRLRMNCLKAKKQWIWEGEATRLKELYHMI